MQHKLIIVFSFILLLSIFSCKTTATVNSESTTSNTIPIREHTIQALLWQQQSAEYKALSHQAYNLAKIYLDQALADNKLQNKSLAIVTDVDETVLDNSPYNAKMVQNDENYTKKTWVDWGKVANAKTVPGALEFFNYAHRKGVHIFYLSNRYFEQKPETIVNLKKAGFPAVDEAHVLLRKETSEKKPRRDYIEKDHKIIMLLGNNLSDFSELFDKQSTAKRNSLVTDLKNEFGRKFIVLPNPMYGDWETKGIYEGSYKWTASQKDSIRKAKLISY